MFNKLVSVSVLVSVIAVAARADYFYVDTRPVFQQIAELEQERILLQLERERIQLMLDMDRMVAEQQRLRGDVIRGGDSDEIRRLEQENARLESANDRLSARLDALESQVREGAPTVATAARPAQVAEPTNLSIVQQFRLLEIVGAGHQLQATIEDTQTGQRIRARVGREIGGYMITSISLDEGVAFMRDGVRETLTIGRRE